MLDYLKQAKCFKWTRNQIAKVKEENQVDSGEV